MNTITLNDGCKVMVSDEDFEIINQFKWTCVENHAYASRWEHRPKKGILMHRQILNAPPGIKVDHKDHNGHNNLRSNIRLATETQNSYNRKQRDNTKSPYKGVVHYPKRRGSKLWAARITVNGTRKCLGYFETAEQAFDAYKEASLQHHGEFSLYHNNG